MLGIVGKREASFWMRQQKFLSSVIKGIISCLWNL